MMMKETDLESAAPLIVGDVVGLGYGIAGIFTPGPSRWHALRVSPQREDQATAWLRRRGVIAFHPVLMRKVRRMGRVREYARRYLPGYVFARFPGIALPHLVVGHCNITGALCRSDGNWGVLHPADLRALYAMRKVEAETEAQRRAMRAAARRAMTVREGEAALFRVGPFSGLHCEVVELQADGGVTVRLQLFGRETEVKASVADMVGVARPC